MTTTGRGDVGAGDHPHRRFRRAAKRQKKLRADQHAAASARRESQNERKSKKKSFAVHGTGIFGNNGVPFKDPLLAHRYRSAVKLEWFELD